MIQLYSVIVAALVAAAPAVAVAHADEPKILQCEMTAAKLTLVIKLDSDHWQLVSSNGSPILGLALPMPLTTTEMDYVLLNGQSFIVNDRSLTADMRIDRITRRLYSHQTSGSWNEDDSGPCTPISLAPKF